MEVTMKLEDDLFFEELSKQISLLLMDDDEDCPLAHCPPVYPQFDNCGYRGGLEVIMVAAMATGATNSEVEWMGKKTLVVAAAASSDKRTRKKRFSVFSGHDLTSLAQSVQYPSMQSPFYLQQQNSTRESSKGTGVFIPRSSRPRRKSKQGKQGSSNSTKSNTQITVSSRGISNVAYNTTPCHGLDFNRY
ncbi:hypothetical protein Ancab_030422 [Ancistrocladus abbreviatus]